ncbi:uncharacterized protein METZ01_LOCUS506951 [marine metagenome]|uniref:Uncharacterized protein n=1 Tax=marine metagenome TaxID=408172 RepID=A0A383EB65_9ZZZZ
MEDLLGTAKNWEQKAIKKILVAALLGPGLMFYNSIN